MNANASRGTPGNPTKDRPTCRGREVRKDPQDDQGAQPTKQFGPEDQREAQALQFVLELAPPDTDWHKIWEVYISDLDPREVWDSSDNSQGGGSI